MLNLFEKKKTTFTLFPKQLGSDFIYTDVDSKNDSILLNEKKEKIGENRHYPPASKEWVNSVYSYNKNLTKTLPAADNAVNRLIKSYFNLSPLFKGKKSKRVQIRFKRLSLNRILVSKSEMKHTNDKVIITVYLYNKNRKFFIYKLKNLYKTFILKIPSLNSSTKKITSKQSSLINRSKTNKDISKSMLVNKRAKGLAITKKRGLITYYIPKADGLKSSTVVNPTIASNRLNPKKKFSTKRFKKTNTLVKSYKTKIYNYMNFTNLTKNRLSRFIFKIKNINIKNKYKSLIREYYSMLNNYKFYNVNNNKSYYINYVNLAKNSYNSSIYNTSNFYTLLKKTNDGSLTFKTKRNNISYDSIIGERKYSSVLVIKNKYSRNIKNMMYKLKSVYRILNIKALLDGMHNNRPENRLAFRLEKDNFFTNMYRLLKKSSFISLSKNVKGLKTGTNLKSKEKINIISMKALKLINKARKHKNFLLKTLKWDNDSFINYENKYYKSFIKKAYKKEILYLYYVKMLSINHSKFKNWFLIGLKKVISKLYNKKIEFNFVNLNYLHLNSDIFSESIATKLRNRQNRLLGVLKKALKLVKLPSINKISNTSVSDSGLGGKESKNFINKYKTLNVNNFNSTMFNSDALNELLHGIFTTSRTALSLNAKGNGLLEGKNLNKSDTYSSSSTQQINVLDSIKHKAVFGVRLEAAGRLSKRLTASRSVFKLKYKGSIKNVDASYKGLSSVVLRGNIKPNIQYTKISSKTRNGSFGLKGWVSGY